MEISIILKLMSILFSMPIVYILNTTVKQWVYIRLIITTIIIDVCLINIK